jgi:hypothetical protein
VLSVWRLLRRRPVNFSRGISCQKLRNKNKQILVPQCAATGTQSPLGSNPGNISNLFSSKSK